MNIPDQAIFVIQRLKNSGYDGYVVGGIVRNLLMCEKATDIDITTNALPEKTMEIFSDYKTITTGLQHGTVTVIVDGVSVEITTYRTENTYTDNRHPDSVNFTTSLFDDTKRRDFTMNAICYNPCNGIIDYHGGCEDIKNKQIRCIGNAEERFREDSLRILRALRFSSTLNFSIEEHTQRAIIENKRLLQNVSKERIYAELCKMICGDNFKNVLLEYTEVFEEFIPDITVLKGFEQKNEHHIYDILTHSAVCVENLPKEPVIRLAGLLHDIGKQDTFTVDQNGTGHFYGHNQASLSRCEKIAQNLKMSNADRNLLLFLVKYHDMQIEATEKGVKRALGKYGEEYLRKLILLKRADNSAQNIEKYNHTEYYDEIDGLIDKVISDNRCFSLKNLAVNGSDLIEIGYKPSKEIKDILNNLLELVIDEKLPNDKKLLLEYVIKNK